MAGIKKITAKPETGKDEDGQGRGRVRAGKQKKEGRKRNRGLCTGTYLTWRLEFLSKPDGFPEHENRRRCHDLIKESLLFNALNRDIHDINGVYIVLIDKK
jgi:hypothetical protein